MTRLRRHLSLHRAWAGWLIALALALRIVVPTGYMADMRDGQVTVRMCDGAGSVPMAFALPGMDHHAGDHGGDHSHDSSAQPCAFAGATIAGLDTVATIAFVAPILRTERFIRALPARGPPPAAHRPLPPSHAPPLHA